MQMLYFFVEPFPLLDFPLWGFFNEEPDKPLSSQEVEGLSIKVIPTPTPYDSINCQAIEVSGKLVK